MGNTKLTEIATLGEFGLIDHLTSNFENRRSSTLSGVGDDAAVIDIGGGRVQLISTDMLMEGINFDLTYFPMKHLGYKAVVVGVSDILAMNARAEQVMISIAVSSKMSVEALDDFYEGVNCACADYNVDLVGGDTTTSLTGFAISITAMGTAEASKVSYRTGAKLNDLVCITSNLGAAYMGLHLLEREKRALEGVPNPQPKFEGYEYLLQRQLKPEARVDIIDSLAEAQIVPTSMIDLSDGLASDVMQICKASKCGVRIYLERIPIAQQTNQMAEELNADPVVAALNGGDDYELLFTVPLELQEQIMRLGGIDVIGHITAADTGAALVTPDGNTIALQAQGIRL